MQGRSEPGSNLSRLQIANQDNLLSGVVAAVQSHLPGRDLQRLGQESAQGLIGGFVHRGRRHANDQVLATDFTDFVSWRPGQKFDLKQRSCFTTLRPGQPGR